MPSYKEAFWIVAVAGGIYGTFYAACYAAAKLWGAL